MGCVMVAPSVLFSDNKAVVDVIESERMTPWCRHIAIPIAFLQHHHKKVYTPRLITSDKMIADIGTKPVTTALHKRFKYWGMGAMNLPSQHHIHYKHLQIQFYEMKYCDILKWINERQCLVSFQSINTDTPQDGEEVVGCWSQSTRDVTRPNRRSCTPDSGVIGHSSFGTSDDEQERK